MFIFKDTLTDVKKLIKKINIKQYNDFNFSESKSLNINYTTTEGYTILHFAAIYHSPLIKDLLNTGININCVTKKGYTPLMYAIIHKADEKILEMMINAGAIVNTNTNRGPAIMIAAIYNPSIINCLIKAGADINYNNNNSQTPLMKVAIYKPGHIEEFIIAGANINDSDNLGKTALMYAIDTTSNRKKIRNQFYIEITLQNITKLIEAGADVNTKDNKGWTPLMYAAKFNTKVVDILLKAGADKHIKTNDGITAFDIAIANMNTGPINTILHETLIQLNTKNKNFDINSIITKTQ